MPTLPKTIATLTCACLLATFPALAGTAAAYPRNDHATTHDHGHAHGAHGKAHEHGKADEHGKAHEHGKPADHLAGLKRGAAHAIAAQLKSVQRLRTAADALDLADEGVLLDTLNVDRTAVQGELADVTDAGSRADLHALMTAAITGRQLAALQVATVTAADGAGTEAASLGASVEGLAGELADLPRSPEKAAAEAALEEAMGLLATVTSDASDVVGLVLGVAPTVSRGDLHSAAVDVHNALDSIEAALLEAETDLAAVQPS